MGDLNELVERLGELADGATGATFVQDACRQAADAITSLIAERDGLRGALKPFADAAAAYDPEEEDDQSPAWQSVFDLGDLRRARTALSLDTNKGDGVC